MAVMYCRHAVLTDLGTGSGVLAVPACSQGLTEALLGLCSKTLQEIFRVEITGRLSPLAVTGLHWGAVTPHI